MTARMEVRNFCGESTIQNNETPAGLSIRNRLADPITPDVIYLAVAMESQTRQPIMQERRPS